MGELILMNLCRPALGVQFFETQCSSLCCGRGVMFQRQAAFLVCFTFSKFLSLEQQAIHCRLNIDENSEHIVDELPV